MPTGILPMRWSSTSSLMPHPSPAVSQCRVLPLRGQAPARVAESAMISMATVFITGPHTGHAAYLSSVRYSTYLCWVTNHYKHKTTIIMLMDTVGLEFHLNSKIAGLFSMRSVTSAGKPRTGRSDLRAGGWNHLMIPSVHFYMWSLHIPWASLQDGGLRRVRLHTQQLRSPALIF